MIDHPAPLGHPSAEGNLDRNKTRDSSHILPLDGELCSATVRESAPPSIVKGNLPRDGAVGIGAFVSCVMYRGIEIFVICTISIFDIKIMRALARFFICNRGGDFESDAIRTNKCKIFIRIEFPIRYSTVGCNVLQILTIVLYIKHSNNKHKKTKGEKNEYSKRN